MSGFVVAQTPAALPDSQPISQPTLEFTRFTDKLELASQTGDFVGLAVAVVRGGEIVFLRTYGVKDISSQEPVGAQTVFRIASLSKGFAASLASLAISDGGLSTTQSVSQLVPEFALKQSAQQRRVTVQNILSHTVGLPPNAYDNLLEANIDPLEILARYVGVDMICSVGQCYAYQNVTFNMISPILEQVAGQDYASLMQGRIFAPLDMQEASLGKDALEGSDNWARPHVRRTRTQWVSVPVKQAYYNLPASSGINASIDDMAKWLRAQLGYNPEVLPEDALERIHQPVIESKSETRRWRRLGNRVRDTHYGLGWRIYDYAGRQVITHSGSVEGYMAQIALVPEHDVGIVMLANARALRAWRILPTFLDAEFGLKEEDWLQLEAP